MMRKAFAIPCGLIAALLVVGAFVVKGSVVQVGLAIVGVTAVLAAVALWTSDRRR